MDKHLKVLYIKVPPIHSPLHNEVIYNTTQVKSELQLMSNPLAKVTFSFCKRWSAAKIQWGLRTKSLF